MIRFIMSLLSRKLNSTIRVFARAFVRPETRPNDRCIMEIIKIEEKRRKLKKKERKDKSEAAGETET